MIFPRSALVQRPFTLRGGRARARAPCNATLLTAATAHRPQALRPLAQRPLALRPLALWLLALRPLALRPLALRPLALRPLALRPHALRLHALRPLTLRPLALRPLTPLHQTYFSKTPTSYFTPYAYFSICVSECH
jgi:hypothetical protein